jgi:hypothetical protein
LGRTSRDLERTRWELGRTPVDLDNTPRDLGKTDQDMGRNSSDLDKTQLELGRTRYNLDKTVQEVGAAATVGGEGLVSWALAIGQAGRAGELASAGSAVAKLTAEFERLRQAMEGSALLGKH